MAARGAWSLSEISKNAEPTCKRLAFSQNVLNYLPAVENLPQVLLDQPLDSSAHFSFHHSCLMPVLNSRLREKPQVGSMYAVLGSLKMLTRPHMSLPCMEGASQCPVRQAQENLLHC